VKLEVSIKKNAQMEANDEGLQLTVDTEDVKAGFSMTWAEMQHQYDRVSGRIPKKVAPPPSE
jgi:hypothetical protein